MKAIFATKYGPPEVLKIQEIEKPAPKDNEVLIKMHAVSVTVGDSRVRGFRVPPIFWLPGRLMLGLFRPKNPILGSIFAGEVESIGKNVQNFKPGDKVFGSKKYDFGAYAEYFCVTEDSVIITMPENYSYEEAAAIPWGGVCSLHFLTKANIKEGQEVLIYGASGSLGTSGIQIAKYFGAKVTGVCSTKNLDLVKSLGANEVIDYTKEDFTLKEKKYDVIYDTVGKTSIFKTVKLLKPSGVYIHAVSMPNIEIAAKLAIMGTKKKFVGGTLTPSKEALVFLKKMIAECKLKPVIDRIYKFEEMVEAHRHVDTGHKRGEVIVKV